MRKQLLLLFAAVAMLATACTKYSYETFEGDPLNTRIYTLENGLKVYMTINEEEPRLQTFIAVKVGAKNDPDQSTGLAHYFEHLMFKGTEKFGTQNYEAEKPLLDEIERLFEVYRTKTDEAERKAIYAQIDSVSQLASKIAIPNEYDKLMAAISAEGTNAWTSFDETVYTEDIPSNQIENWAKIQADRFKNNVIRGFHTELETVYEEYNMSLTRDGNKAYYGLLSLLYPNHPSGQHTVLGYQEHLKNPSISTIKKYYRTYYVPNNMAICLAGDFNPDEMIAIIDKYFGDMEPNPSLPAFEVKPEDPITTPQSKTLYGQEAEFIYMGWRCPGIKSEESDIALLASKVLSNGKCGLIDVNINQQQKAQGLSAYAQIGADYGGFYAEGMPKQGQSLDDVKALLLAEVAKLRNGDFDENIIKATLANYKLSEMHVTSNNRGRAQSYVRSFINGTSWQDEIDHLARLEKITKAQIVEWAKANLRDDNFAVIYKLQGEDTTQKKIDKPQITPIATNRDAVSPFLAEVQNSQVEPIAPVFIDYSKDLTVEEYKGSKLLYKKNTSDGIFSMKWIYDFGANNDPKLALAERYWSYLGTDKKSLQQIEAEFYAMACNFNLSVLSNKMEVSLSGLAENQAQALALLEEYIANVKGNDAVLARLKVDIFKQREDTKLDQTYCFWALRDYVEYGAEAIRARTLTNKELQQTTSEELLERIHNLGKYKHTITYYGPAELNEVKSILDKSHKFGNEQMTAKKYYMQPTPENKVYFAQYDAKQIYYYQYSNRGEKYDHANDPEHRLYNAYFGGGMNSIVFQEMREARALAYNANSRLYSGSKLDEPYYFNAFIATQNDKMQQAVEAFEEIINDMPESEAAFNIAKQSLLGAIATSRTIKEQTLTSYINNVMYKGLTQDPNKAVYEKVQSLTLDNVKAFQQKWIKDRKYYYSVLGDKSDLDIDFLRTLGEFEELTSEQIFGY